MKAKLIHHSFLDAERGIFNRESARMNANGRGNSVRRLKPKTQNSEPKTVIPQLSATSAASCKIWIGNFNREAAARSSANSGLAKISVH
jgi:hypothetical protein